MVSFPLSPQQDIGQQGQENESMLVMLLLAHPPAETSPVNVDLTGRK